MGRPEYRQSGLVPFLDAVAAQPANGVGFGAFVLGHVEWDLAPAGD